MRGIGTLKQLQWLARITEDFGRIEGRKAFQKSVYFLQILGLDLQYDFKWSLYGPYSSELASDIRSSTSLEFLKNGPDLVFEYGQIPSQIKKLEPVTENESKILEKAKEILQNLSPRELELIASIHYLWHTAYLPAKNKKDIFSLLENQKPNKFTTKQKTWAWKFLKQHKLI